MLDVRSFHESFYGTPKPAETGRRGKKRQPKAKEEPENEIAVIGVHYRSFDDDSMAAFVNSPAAQVPWNGEKDLLIDRYDVRHLLQDLSGIRRRRRPASPSLDVSKEELDFERYRDLEGLEDPSPAPEDDANKYDENGSGGLYQRVGFTYSCGGDKPAHRESGDRTAEEAAFNPPFFVPEQLLPKLPSSLKVHQIMAGTAKFVIEHGGQAEIVLRVKQASNPTFGFLMPDHYHHEYFRFLVDNPQLVGIGLNAEPVAAVEVLSEEAQGGLSLLGTAYGETDDEDEPDVATEAKRNHRQVEDGEGLGKGENVSEEGSGGSEHGSHGRNSPTSEQRTIAGSENGTCESGDSRDPANAVEILENEPQDVASRGGGEVSGSVTVGTLTGLPEPLPPGTETLDPMEVESEEPCVPPEYPEHELPPYKEPPLQQRRIIEKMVEFISRNGKEFEAIVRERDKKDGRFQFLLPWNEFYPYFSRSLQVAQQANASSDTSDAPLTDESKPSTSEGPSEDQQLNDHFLEGVPYWDSFSVPDTSTYNNEVAVDEIENSKPDVFHHEVGGMGFDAVMAAVRAATRRFSRAVEDNELVTSQPKSPQTGEPPPPIGSDDAVIAAIRAATGAARRSKAEEPSDGGKGELDLSKGLTASSGATDHTSLHVVQKTQEEEKNFSGSGAPVSNSEFGPGFPGDGVVVGTVAAKAAALAARQEGDSADALLSPTGKRKAERLKRAKLFAAMLREGNGAIVRSGQGSGSHGVSATASVEKSSQAGISLDVNPKQIVSKQVNDVQEATKSALDNGIPPVREQTTDALVAEFDHQDRTQHRIEEGKEHETKAKSKEADEKPRKHHRKRKSHYDGEDGKKEVKDDSDREQRRDRRHDHYEEKRKDRRRHRDEDVKIRDKNGDITKEEVDGDRYRYDFEDRREARDSRKDKRYQHDMDSNISSRHRYNYEEMSHEDRHWHDLDGKVRSGRHRRRHGSEEGKVESRHQNSVQNRKDDEGDDETEEKRKERKHRHGSEERREHRHDSDEKKKDRRHSSHGKRKKQKEHHGRDVSEGEDDRDHTHRKSRKHRRETERDNTGGKPSTDDGNNPVVRTQRSGEHHEVVGPLQIERSTVSTVKELPPSTPVDVPDDIRAKVRAMLAGF